ncbi:hypothetical protein D3C71_1298190 [compost metagenome]
MGILTKVLSALSGNTGLKISDQLLFDKVIGFRGIVPGVGTSTVVQNVALALSKRTRYSICILDTSFLYGIQYAMLMKEESENKDRKDFLDVDDDLSKIVINTKINRVKLFCLNNRSILDMLSSRDSELVVDKLIKLLKAYFDIVLVDLSYELTNITTYCSIKCNKVINIADESLKCMYNLAKSLNLMATLATPIAKGNLIVLNKVLPDVLSNTKGVISNAKLTLLCEIPFSKDIAVAGVSGKLIYTASSSSKDEVAFSNAIDNVVNFIIDKTPLNAKYVDDLTVEENEINI